jgi:prevent-host-death family protein
MDIGIKDAKNNLSNLVAQARTGTRIFLTNRGERMVELVPVKDVKAPAPERGLGWLKGTIKLPKNYQKWKRQSSKAVMKDMGLL